MTELLGTQLAGCAVPFTTEDTYAVTDSKYGKGGWREVADTLERDAITTQRRTAGMAVYVTSEDKVYILADDLVTWTVYHDQAKQDVLVSGTTIKTVNNTSLLGSGNISITNDTYIYEQGVASDTWVINHNLNKFPSVTIIDTAGSVIVASVTYTNENSCTVVANAPFKGKAYLN